jgi:demethylmenaquinone methyltransferase/2-methoxy-6-polyprenyl-1,4-benzoquinol methylase
MSHLTGNARARYIQSMFARIARRYDLMNRLMTAGQDQTWRKEVIRQMTLRPGDRLLDLGCGTGDLVLEAVRQTPGVIALPADFTLEMMRVGQARRNSLPWTAADALHLPFASQSFDAVVSGFLVRNVADLPRALQEQWRILKPGGQIAILDTTRPPRNALTPLVMIHLRVVIPTLGRILAGSPEAYTYLPSSTESFLSAESLADALRSAGFRQVQFQRRMFGTIALHFGVKGR